MISISLKEKHQLERNAIEKLLFNTGAQRQLILDLWQEYEEQSTPESKVVMQLDKLDAAIQAFEYEVAGYDVSEFYPYTLKKLTDPLLIQIFSGFLNTRGTKIDYYQQCFVQLRSGG